MKNSLLKWQQNYSEASQSLLWGLGSGYPSKCHCKNGSHLEPALPPVPHWSGKPVREAEPTTTTATAGSVRSTKMQMKVLCWCASSPTHPASRNVTVGGMRRHAGRDSLLSNPPTRELVLILPLTCSSQSLSFQEKGTRIFLGIKLIDCHLHWEESCQLKSQFFKLQLYF